MIHNENFSHQITAITSNLLPEANRCLIAMADSDYTDPYVMYFSVYEVVTKEDVRLLLPRVKIEVPDDELVGQTVMGRGDETMRAQSRVQQEFSSAAASQVDNTVSRRNTVFSSSNGPGKTPLYPFVSQVIFSNNQTYVACLVSGAANRILIYER